MRMIDRRDAKEMSLLFLIVVTILTSLCILFFAFIVNEMR